MAFKKVAEISIDKLEDRKTVTAILHANGYTVGPGKRKKTPTGKQLDYYLKEESVCGCRQEKLSVCLVLTEKSQLMPMVER